MQTLSEIAFEAALTVEHTGRGQFVKRVMRALAKVPRNDFVPEELQSYAYINRSLRICCDKTVSQPYMVALMTDLLEREGTDRSLEIGIGADYQAAILAELAEGAGRRLKRLGFGTMMVHFANGYVTTIGPIE